ncbi:alkaline phosphatase [Paracoccus sp. (in: a-proteobacteria)]|uniref:alkaline phosphatase n=1 Tax=Paracoccus sp. TaxID=267 RepID=UPI00396C86E6
MQIVKRTTLALLMTSALVAPALAQDGQARNVILMITDGTGMESFRAASYYRHGALGHEVYDDFDVHVFSATHPLNTSNEPTMSNEGAVTFDPTELFSDTPSDEGFEGKLMNYPGFFAGYDYARRDFTDSAAAATALASGTKSFNNAINWSNNDEPLKHVGEYVVESGRALGVVSSVQFSHATPAGFLAHNVSRNDYQSIGAEIIDSELATVVFGTGHPLFDANGKRIEAPTENDYRYVGDQDRFDRLVAGETGWQLIETREDFEALANGEMQLEGERILGLAQNQQTLQFNRDGVAAGGLLETSPSLSTMTRAALNVLGKDEDGFFLMVEGGAVDWAAHANNLPRLIEEQVDFNESVEAAVEWVEANSSWDETMIVVTTDHGNGLLQGPNSDKVAYEPIVNQGAGAMPLVRWHSDNHTRELVPLYAKGPGAEFFREVAEAAEGLAVYDVDADARVWVDNTDVFRATMNAMGLEAAEPVEQAAAQ